MQQPVRLLMNRRDNGCGTMPGREHSDSTGHVDQHVAIHIVDQRAVCAIDDDVGGAGNAGGDGGAAALQEGTAVGTGYFRAKMDGGHGGSSNCES
jgi:hypothetical protein